MKFTALAISIATACILSLSAINPVAADDNEVENRNMPKTTGLIGFGKSGLFFKKRDSFVKVTEAKRHKTTVIKRQNKNWKKKRVAAIMNENVIHRKRGVKYTNSGEGTFFSPNRGSCGWKNTGDDLIVAVNAADMGNKKKSGKNVNCGRMVEIVNSAGKTVTAKVSDTVSI